MKDDDELELPLPYWGGLLEKVKRNMKEARESYLLGAERRHPEQIQGSAQTVGPPPCPSSSPSPKICRWVGGG